MKLFFRQYGDGHPLLLLHGLYGSSDNWVTFAKKLSGKCTVYLPDLRNHGQSPHSELCDYNAMSNDIYELAEELKLNKFFIAGHSLGGKVATAFAIRHPQMVSGLAVFDISPFTDGNTKTEIISHHINIFEAINSCNLKKVEKREDADLQLSHLIPSDAERALIMKNLQRLPGNEFRWKMNVASLRKNLVTLMQGVDPGEAAEKEVTGFPVLFLRGDKSEYLLQDDFPAILKIFPAAEFRIIPRAGHWLQVDNPEDLFLEMDEMISSY